MQTEFHHPVREDQYGRKRKAHYNPLRGNPLRSNEVNCGDDNRQ